MTLELRRDNATIGLLCLFMNFGHHQELHRHGNEIAWWANVHVAPLEAAKSLWEASQFRSGTTVGPRLPVIPVASQSTAPK
jgi:hypothetical protein